MRTLLIGYDLNKSGKNYADVIEYIKAQGTWWHHLDSTWIIRTEKTAKEVRDEVKSVGLDSDDELLVVEHRSRSTLNRPANRVSPLCPRRSDNAVRDVFPEPTGRVKSALIWKWGPC